MKEMRIVIVSITFFCLLPIGTFSYPTYDERYDNNDVGYSGGSSVSDTDNSETDETYAYYHQEKRQAHTQDFGPNAIVTQANCDVTESAAERTVYECFDGAQRPNGDISLENLIKSGRFDVVRGDCETTENGVTEENGRTIHKIVYMCYENDNENRKYRSSETIQTEQISNDDYNPSYGTESLTKHGISGPTYLPKVRSKRSTQHIFYYKI